MSTLRRRAAARASILAGAVALAFSVAAQAQDLTFDIGAGDLKAALEAYAKQTGQQLVYQPDDVKGRSTPGVHGAMSSEQALTALLAGTGLKVNKDASGAIAIFPAEAVAGGASTKTAGSDQKLEEIIVTATAVSSIYVTSRSATRLDVDPMSLPMSISAVQADLMKMQQSRTLTDVLNNVAGVDVSSSSSITMRGFRASVARNGTIQSSSNLILTDQRPTVAVDRIEVVKGPEQILQGSGAGIGGTVNMITKVPEAEPLAYLGSAIGSDGYWRLDADLNDTLLGDEGNRLMGRLVGSTADAGDTDVGYVGASTDFVSAGLRWTNDASGSDLAAVYEYNDILTPASPYVVAMGDSFHSGMKEYRFGPRESYTRSEIDTVDVNFHQRIWESWSFNVNYIWTDVVRTIRGAVPQILLNPSTVRSFSTKGPRGTSTSTANDVKADLRGTVNTGPVAHQLVLAYDYNSNEYMGGEKPITRTFWSTDLNTRDRTFISSTQGAPAGFWNDYVETGVLVVDHVSWNAWSGLFGVRWADYDVVSGSNGFPNTKANDGATLPQYGLVYEVVPNVSLYASGGEGYSSNYGLRTWQGEPLPDETSTQYEAGVKALVLDRQLAVTLAIYRIKQTNVAAVDLDHESDEDEFFYTIPGLTNKGVELEVSGQPVRGLDVRANYTYTQQEDQDGEPPYFGYVPSSFNLWAQYWLSRETGQGWWGGFGLSAKDAAIQPTADGPTTRVPGFTIFDLQAGYSSSHWNAIAGYKNVADIQTYYPTSQRVVFGVPQPGASFTFDLSYKF